MIFATVAYLCLTLVFAWSAPRLAVRVHPAWSVRLIVPAAVAFAGAGLFILAANALTWAAQRPDVAELGDWSTRRLRLDDPVPHAIALLSASLLAASLVALATTGYRRTRALAEVHTAVRPCGADHGGVVLLDDERPDAFTTPGRRGRIVVTSGLMNALTPPQRAALIAHERSHLRHRHAFWVLAIDLASAVNPLLRSTAQAMTHAVERWADEDAAVAVDDRTLVARTVALASLLHKHGAAYVTNMMLAATGGDTPARVRALLGGRPRRNGLAAAALVLMVVAAGVAVVGMQRSADALFDASHAR
jgi:Zn-dependent protease with chaperone function